MIEEPGGYERDAGNAFGLFVRPHKHVYRSPPRGVGGKNLYDDLKLRCRYCDRTEQEVAAATREEGTP